MIVEVGIKLNKQFKYYDDMLIDAGFINDFQVVTHDIYYTNKNLNGLSENGIKNACIRLRSCNDSNYEVQNNLIPSFKVSLVTRDELPNFEKKLYDFGYKKIFDTTKKDYHYAKKGMDSKIQLQQIEKIGLVVYFDNKKYYEFDLETQRKNLISDLNFYGFQIQDDTLGIDKLRTFYYGKEMYSKNQNG